MDAAHHVDRDGCARCCARVEVPLHLARHVITADGSLRELCPACDGGDGPRPDESDHADIGAADDSADPVAPSDATDPVAVRARWPRYAALGAIVAAAVVTAFLVSNRLTSAEAAGDAATAEDSSVVSAVDHPAPAADHGSETAAPSESSDPLSDLRPEEELAMPGPLSDEEALAPTVEDRLEELGEAPEEMFPSLAHWVFPVEGTDEEFPLRPSRRFGAERAGVRRTECGRGHCGVDLRGKRGTPILAVTWGRVSRIRQDDEPPSGKYVRIEHPDGSFTYYMHLDEINSELRLGDEVEPGQELGLLGSTGVLQSVPHLHFSLELPRDERRFYVDPTRYLRRAIGDLP
ncbi:MAG: M23 family metallopeptidase [Myxococcota bacterium]